MCAAADVNYIEEERVDPGGLRALVPEHGGRLLRHTADVLNVEVSLEAVR